MTFAHPQYLVETDWLETHLTDPDLRVLDCTVFSDVDNTGPILKVAARPGHKAISRAVASSIS